MLVTWVPVAMIGSGAAACGVPLIYLDRDGPALIGASPTTALVNQ
jgi:hypothetical protein